MDFDSEIGRLVRQGACRVPPCPAHVLKLREIVGRADHSLDEVVHCLQADALLASSILRVANSSFYRRGQDVTALPIAVGRIGEAELSRIALATGLSSEALSAGPLAELRRRVWHESVTSAVVCEALARVVKLKADDMFVVGLLHDMGRMVCVTAMEHILKDHPEIPERSEAEWWKTVEQYHVELGLVLAAKWDLPALVASCISRHHEAVPSGPFEAAVRLVASSDRVVDLLQTGAAVTAEWLATLPILSTEAQRTQFAALLPGVPELVAGFEDSSRAAVSTSRVTPPPANIGQAVAQGVTVALKGGKGPVATVVWVKESAVCFDSPSALAANFIEELCFETPEGPLKVWVKVTRCQLQSPGTHRVEASPFAASTEVLARWRKLAQASLAA